MDFLSGWLAGNDYKTSQKSRCASSCHSTISVQKPFLHCWIWLIGSLRDFPFGNYGFSLSFLTFDSYNYFDLLYFLANILTGLINLTIPTMYTSDVWAMIILVLYSITLCGVHPFFLCLLFWKGWRGNKNGCWWDFLYTYFYWILNFYLIWPGDCLRIKLLAVIKGLFRFWTLLCIAVPWLTLGIDLSFSQTLTTLTCYTLPVVGWHPSISQMLSSKGVHSTQRRATFIFTIGTQNLVCDFRSVQKSILIDDPLKDFIPWDREFLLERFITRPNATRRRIVTLIPARPFDRLY